MSFKILLTTVLLSVASLACHTKVVQKCPVVKVDAVRLPDLNVARFGHHTFYINGEAVVIGGHTDGFVPTQTAEYLKDDQWHTLSTIYTHDQGLAIAMKNGRILVAGGHEQPLGIGQLFSLELYDPASHTFEGFGCMVRKRCFAEAMEMDSGRVVVTGNWYQEDGVECFDGTRQNKTVKHVSQNRSLPYIFRTSKDNAVIFSPRDYKAELFDTMIVDRLKGEPFTVPLFSRWQPLYNLVMPHISDSFIGDEEKGIYAYLMTATDSTGQLALVKVEGERFSLLSTKCPIPMTCQGNTINYFSYVVADRQKHRAYVVGMDDIEHDSRLYVLAVDYQKSPAEIKLYYTDVLSGIGMCQPVLNSDGNLVMAGGTKGNNYTPCASSWLLPVGTEPSRAQECSIWVWWLGGIVVLGLLVFLVYLVIYHQRGKSRQSEVLIEEGDDRVAQPDESAEQLFEHISQLMDEQRIYLNSNLKVGDVAAELDVPSRMVSDSIKVNCGCSFAQFVNGYRIEYAKQLLRNHPDAKMTAVYVESGFSNEMSFFRTFKVFTGMTPKEWLVKNN